MSHDYKECALRVHQLGTDALRREIAENVKEMKLQLASIDRMRLESLILRKFLRAARLVSIY